MVVCFPGSKIYEITKRVDKLKGAGKGGSILVHVQINTADRKGITAIVKKHEQLE